MEDDKVNEVREEIAETLAKEEAKRNRMWDPGERMKVLLATLEWAEAQLRPEQRRNTMESALRRQALLLEQMKEPMKQDGVIG
ncbi:MAG: hypothetical protein ACKOS8_07700 [Gemmataceae bacterium]